MLTDPPDEFSEQHGDCQARLRRASCITFTLTISKPGIEWALYYPMVYGWCRRDEAIEFIFAIFLKYYVDFAQKPRGRLHNPLTRSRLWRATCTSYENALINPIVLTSPKPLAHELLAN